MSLQPANLLAALLLLLGNHLVFTAGIFAAENFAAENIAVESVPAESLAAESPAAESPAAASPAVESPAAESPAAESPVAESPAAQIAREPYSLRHCTSCHGTDGKGNEAVQAPRLAGMEGWYLARQLENFRAGIRGSHSEDTEGIAMQAVAAVLTDAAIADTLEWAASWKPAPAEVTVQADVARGRQFYATCAACHGSRAEGNATLGAPALAGQNDWYLVTQLRNFMAGYRGQHPDDSYGQQMRGMANTLVDETGILDVVSYINSLAER